MVEIMVWAARCSMTRAIALTTFGVKSPLSFPPGACVTTKRKNGREAT